jgi:hypothetical protein
LGGEIAKVGTETITTQHFRKQLMNTTKIIDGKRYNTETATEIANWSNGLGYSDFRFVEESLYRTQKGVFFLVGKGGALSTYAQSCGNNSTCGGSEWKVLSDEEAFEWLQYRDQTEQLERLFADKIQDA